LHDALPIWCRSSASWFWWWSYWVCSVLELGACSSVPVDSSRSGEQAFCGGPGGPPACPATRQGRQRQHPDQGVDQAVVAADVSVVRVRLPITVIPSWWWSPIVTSAPVRPVPGESECAGADGFTRPRKSVDSMTCGKESGGRILDSPARSPGHRQWSKHAQRSFQGALREASALAICPSSARVFSAASTAALPHPWRPDRA